MPVYSWFAGENAPPVISSSVGGSYHFTRRSQTLFLVRLIVMRSAVPQMVVRIFRLLMDIAEPGIGLVGFSVSSKATIWAASRKGISCCQGRMSESAADAEITLNATTAMKLRFFMRMNSLLKAVLFFAGGKFYQVICFARTICFWRCPLTRF